MLDYIGIKCPVCEKTFEENDDIVVCPVCGAPYHRHCYMEKGECIFTELHENGETWKAPKEEKEETASPSEIKDQECPNCGILNPHSSIFCSHCGTALKIEKGEHKHAYQPNMYQPMNRMNDLPDLFDPMGGTKPTEVLVDDITFGEVSKVVQQNTRYYLPTFKKIQNKRGIKFNFTAFAFSGAWLLFRKQYKAGTIVTALMFALYIAEIFTSEIISMPRIYSVLEKAGLPFDGVKLSSDQITAMAYNMNIEDLIVISIPSFILIAMFAIMLIVGFMANKLYLKNCIKKIRETRNSSVNGSDYSDRILEQGGVNTNILIVVFVCYMLCTYLPYIV